MVDDDILDGGGEAAPNDELGSVGTDDAGALTGIECLSCGASTVGIFCANCGQKNDDLRRSSFLLIRDFLRDTFGFDSRMWRTLGLLAIAPGAVASSYTAGKRSQYTPPVRLFLVVSFLFFLILGLTNTMIAALEVSAVENAKIQSADPSVTIDQDGDVETRSEPRVSFSGDLDIGDDTVKIDSNGLDCRLSVNARFFVRPENIERDNDLWRRCADSIEGKLTERLKADEVRDVKVGGESKTDEETISLVRHGLNGVSNAIENPVAFNRAVNAWLPRIMFLMTPILALILALFIRGKDALIFDHIVFALYSHAALFAIVGLTIILGQTSLPNVGLVAFLSIAAYFIIGLKRTYRRGWVKTIWTAMAGGMLYTLILTVAVSGIVFNIVWGSL